MCGLVNAYINVIIISVVKEKFLELLYKLRLEEKKL